jgi:hypothetical protein
VLKRTDRRGAVRLLASLSAKHVAYLGHRNIQHTVRYTELRPDRFKDFWR